ncbi:hypothetical protein KM043_011302 [Ampulex compressa]|nr:hypothetical protein KM043_011302 [Ampulex compressa]
MKKLWGVAAAVDAHPTTIHLHRFDRRKKRRAGTDNSGNQRGSRRNRVRGGVRRRRMETSRGKTESSGGTCANYFAKQSLVVVAGAAKSFNRCDTGSIGRYDVAGQYVPLRLQCRMSRSVRRPDTRRGSDGSAAQLPKGRFFFLNCKGHSV